MKTLLVLLLFVTPFLTSAQTTKYRAFESSVEVSPANPNKNAYPDTAWHTRDIAVIIDQEHRRLEIKGLTDTVIIIGQMSDRGYDEDLDAHIITFRGIDQDQVPCGVLFAVFPENDHNHVATLAIIYDGNKVIYYRLKNDDGQSL